MSQQFTLRNGVVTITDAGTFTLTGAIEESAAPQPEPPSVPSGLDQIDLSQAVITRESPDVRHWPIGATLTRLSLGTIQNATIDFTKRNGADAWPFVTGPEGGEIQYTLWVGCFLREVWYLAGSILCISRGPDDNYVPTGPTLVPGQLPNNWYYFCGEPLASHQPGVDEPVAWFLTAGVQRRNDIHTVAERTQVVITPFAPGTYTF